MSCIYTDAQIIEQAAVTRQLQKSYFRYRDPISLRDARQAEKLLDTLIEAWEAARKPTISEPYPRQRSLF
jgi:hypothetical protein